MAIYQLLLAFLFLTTVMQSNKVFSYQHKVGDLDSWGLPTSTNPQVYAKWSKYHSFKIGDSLLFLYPPSQDSVLQVTSQSYNTCDLKEPIVYMNNGNSLFNITSEGELFFISGQKGHCEKKQRLHILVGNVTETAFSPEDSLAPSYQNAFGTVPAPPSSSSLMSNFPVFVTVSIGLFVFCGILKA